MHLLSKTTRFLKPGSKESHITTQSDLVEAPRTSEWQYQVMTKESAFHLGSWWPFRRLRSLHFISSQGNSFPSWACSNTDMERGDHQIHTIRCFSPVLNKIQLRLWSLFLTQTTPSYWHFISHLYLSINVVPTLYEIVINITKHVCMMTGLESKTEMIKGSIDKNSLPLS